MNEQDVAVKLQEIESRSRSNTKRIDDLTKRQSDMEKLAEGMARLDERQNSMDGDLKEIKTDVKKLTGKSGDRWDGIVDKLIWLIVGAAVAALFAKAGIII